MWFGTIDGLNRFDGYEFTIFKYDAANAGSISSNDIQAIIEDENGKLWLGTDDGVNRFDPLTGGFTRYKHIPGNPNSLGDDETKTMIRDSKGFIWIGTKNGLNRFDPGTETFERFQHQPTDPHSLSHNNITVLFEGNKGMIWIGTSAGGLNRYDRTTGQFRRYVHNTYDSNTLCHDTINDICIDSAGMIWVATQSGLDHFDPQTERFTHYRVGAPNSQGLKSNWITFVFEDSRGDLWVGTDREGLFLFDRKKEEFFQVGSGTSSGSALNSNRITIIYEDISGNLWIGTWDGGINLMEYSKKVFLHLRHDADNPASLSSNSVYQIDEDSKGNIWIGTGRGMNRYDPQQNNVSRFANTPEYPDWLASEAFFALFIDGKDNIWGGTRSHGVVRIDPKTHLFFHYRHHPQKNSISPGPIWTIEGDHIGTIWIGSGEGGLNQLDPETGKIRVFYYEPENPHSISNNVITSIWEDHRNMIWIGTKKGLNCFVPSAKRIFFTRYLHHKDDPTSIKDDYIYSIYEDKEHVIWVGTCGGGLNRFNRTSQQFTHFTRKKNGLPDDTIYGILGDDEGNLWLSTNRGLCKFNPRNLTARNYDVTDGLQSNEFNLSAYKSSKGMMFFGGVNGLNVFYPEHIMDNPLIPPVYITRCKIFNEPVPIGPLPDGRTILKKHISYTQEMRLSYKENSISFEFAALNYIQPKKNQYAFILENFETKWNQAKHQRKASYTNLPPGRYTFRVKGSNNDGVWNEKGAVLNILISPPFWQTWWFRILVTLIIAGIVMAVYKIRKLLILKKIREEEKIKTEKLEYAELLAGGISHDFNNLLTVIIGNIHLAMEKIPPDHSLYKNLYEMEKSAILATDLTRQFITFSRGGDPVFRTESLAEIIGESTRVISQNQEESERIRCQCYIPQDIWPVTCDFSQVVWAMTNLFKNSIEAMPNGGTIVIEAKNVDYITAETDNGISLSSNSGRYVKISVRDEGVGIPGDHMKKIFDPYFTTRDDVTQKGLGLGLAIVQSIIKKHNGAIYAESELSVGTTINIFLPAAAKVPD